MIPRSLARPESFVGAVRTTCPTSFGSPSIDTVSYTYIEHRGLYQSSFHRSRARRFIVAKPVRPRHRSFAPSTTRFIPIHRSIVPSFFRSIIPSLACSFARTHRVEFVRRFRFRDIAIARRIRDRRHRLHLVTVDARARVRQRLETTTTTWTTDDDAWVWFS